MRSQLICALIFAVVPAPAFAAGGTVSGTVVATPAKHLEDTVVYLVEVPGSRPARTANLDQKEMRFVPRILLVTRGDTVRFLNHDAVSHNVYSPSHEGYDLGTFKRGEVRSHTFDQQTGVYTQLCRLHTEMLGYIFVGQNPYAAVVDAKGRFVIKDVPPGTYEVAVWNPKLRAPAQKATVAAGKTVEVNFSLRR